MTSNALKWHGGKTYLAKWIISNFPARDQYSHYVETHFGGGAVLFAHNPEGVSEVINDINADVMNFWHVLWNEQLFEKFKRQCEATPFSESLWDHIVKNGEQAYANETDAAVARAWRFFVKYRQSRQGIGKSFANTSKTRTRRSMNEQVSSWLGAVEGLPEAHARLKRVMLRSADALEIIRAEDSPSTFFYCDPPYMRDKRASKDVYEFEMTDAQHEDLLSALAKIKGKFALSGYDSDLYRMWSESCGWRVETKDIDNKASSAEVKEIKTECLWMNY